MTLAHAEPLLPAVSFLPETMALCAQQHATLLEVVSLPVYSQKMTELGIAKP